MIFFPQTITKVLGARRYGDTSKNQFRQYPLDCIESIGQTITGIARGVTDEVTQKIAVIGLDTAGLTPVIVNLQGTSHVLLNEFPCQVRFTER